MLDSLLAPFSAVGDLVTAGGSLVGWICAAGILMWTLVIDRWWFFKVRMPNLVEQYLKIWKARSEHQSWEAHQVRKKLLSKVSVEMSANLPLLKVLVPLCPLLGLVGTVLGMLEVFDSMAILGSADARSMASGVSKAMNCTMTGLAVSISGMYPAYYFRNRIKRETELLADRFEY